MDVPFTDLRMESIQSNQIARTMDTGFCLRQPRNDEWADLMGLLQAEKPMDSGLCLRQPRNDDELALWMSDGWMKTGAVVTIFHE